MTDTITRAADFLGTLGVNTHIPYTDGGYANVGNIAADLQYLGITQVRDGISDGYAGSASINSYIALAQQGVQFTFNIFGGGAITSADIKSQLALVDKVAQAVPGSVIAVEGANEINNFALSYNGVGGLQGAVNLQRAIYSAVHSDPNLAGVAVDYFTGYAAGSIGVGPNPATTAGLADYDTQHPYPNQGDAPYRWVNRTQALGNENPADGPAVYTETGYTTNGGTNGGVNQAVQARYTLDLLMDTAKSGIAKTYLYQLMDAYQPGSPQGDDGFGLFDPDNAPKAAATAIHNLTTILADPGATASSFATKASVAFSIANLPDSNDSFVIQKSGGATDLVLWNEPDIWNEASGTQTSAASTNVTVSLGATYQSVKVFDPLAGTAPIRTYTNVSSLNVGVTDHPVIVEVGPAATAVSNHTITLNMSEDFWNTDAAFSVSVDGTQVGGVNTVSALHSSGDATVFNLSGDWGAGLHNVAVSFINDAYGGSVQTDRNLYVNSIAYDGVTQTAHATNMYRNSTVTAAVGSTAAAHTGPADVLTLHLSADQWAGNAQFALMIDGKQVSSPQDVTALHSAGAWEDFSFSGTFGAGAHTVGVKFLNDAYGGSSATDRNLYSNGVTINGTTYGSGAVALGSNSTTNYSIVTTQ